MAAAAARLRFAASAGDLSGGATEDATAAAQSVQQHPHSAGDKTHSAICRPVQTQAKQGSQAAAVPETTQAAAGDRATGSFAAPGRATCPPDSLLAPLQRLAELAAQPFHQAGSGGSTAASQNSFRQPSRDLPDSLRCLFFGCVPPSVSRAELLALFRAFGDVEELNAYTTEDGSQLLGCGTVAYRLHAAAMATKAALDGGLSWFGDSPSGDAKEPFGAMLVDWARVDACSSAKSRSSNNARLPGGGGRGCSRLSRGSSSSGDVTGQPASVQRSGPQHMAPAQQHHTPDIAAASSGCRAASAGQDSRQQLEWQQQQASAKQSEPSPTASSLQPQLQHGLPHQPHQMTAAAEVDDHPAAPPAQRTLFYARVPVTVGSDELLRLFSSFGPVQSLTPFSPRSTRHKCGMGVVVFASVDAAAAAKSLLHGSFTWPGVPATMVVEWHKPPLAEASTSDSAPLQGACTRAELPVACHLQQPGAQGSSQGNRQTGGMQQGPSVSRACQQQPGSRPQLHRQQPQQGCHPAVQVGMAATHAVCAAARVQQQRQQQQFLFQQQFLQQLLLQQQGQGQMRRAAEPLHFQQPQQQMLMAAASTAAPAARSPCFVLPAPQRSLVGAATAADDSSPPVLMQQHAQPEQAAAVQVTHVTHSQWRPVTPGSPAQSDEQHSEEGGEPGQRLSSRERRWLKRRAAGIPMQPGHSAVHTPTEESSSRASSSLKRGGDGGHATTSSGEAGSTNSDSTRASEAAAGGRSHQGGGSESSCAASMLGPAAAVAGPHQPAAEATAAAEAVNGMAAHAAGPGLTACLSHHHHQQQQHQQQQQDGFTAAARSSRRSSCSSSGDPHTRIAARSSGCCGSSSARSSWASSVAAEGGGAGLAARRSCSSTDGVSDDGGDCGTAQPLLPLSRLAAASTAAENPDGW